MELEFGQYASDGHMVYCDFAETEGWANDGVCPFCGDTDHRSV